MFSENSKHYLVAVVSLLAAVFFIHQAITFEKSYPKYNDLLFSEGELSEVKFVGRTSKVPSSLRFSLSGNDDEFVYHSMSGVIITVRDLTNIGSIAKVGYAEEGKGRMSVYDLEIDGSKVRTYEEIRAARKSDNKWAFFLVPFLIFGAIFSLRLARRH